MYMNVCMLPLTVVQAPYYIVGGRVRPQPFLGRQHELTVPLDTGTKNIFKGSVHFGYYLTVCLLTMALLR